MLDIAVAYNRFKFLGFEFLTWLWFSIDGDTDKTRHPLNDFSIGNRIALENRRDNKIEIITIKGDDAGLEEGLLALQKGALVTEINLIYVEDQNKWQFTLKGENLSINNIRHPDIGPYESSEDVDAFVFEKIHHYNKVVEIIDQTFKLFIASRISGNWIAQTVPQIKRWIKH
jgi:hypothetical protein